MEINIENYKTQTIELPDTDLMKLSELLNIDLEENREEYFFKFNLTSLSIDALFSNGFKEIDENDDELSVSLEDFQSIKELFINAIEEEYLYIEFWTEMMA